MRVILVMFALAMLCPFGHAEFIDTAATRPETTNTLVLATPAPVVPAVPINLGRHHIALGVLGIFQASSNDFTIPEIGFDASDGQSIFINYRYSFDCNLDFVVDSRGWVSEEDFFGATITTTVVGFGAGVRYTAGGLGGRVFPYIQASALSVGETVSGSAGVYTITAESKQELGFAVNSGVEIRLGRLISIPIEAMYLFGKPADDVSGFGVTAGISFNWGRIE